jgi:hypothetical protein
MNVSEALNYPFKDSKALTKVLIGIVIFIIPIVNLIGFGYSLRVIRDVAKGKSDMPEWDNWGGDFVKGLLLTVAQFIYSLPFILVFCACIGLASITGTFSEEAGGASFTVLLCCVLPAILLGAILVSVVFIPAMTHYAIHDNFSAAFLDFGGRFKDVTQNFSPLLTIILYGIIISVAYSVVASFTAGIAGLLGWLFWLVWLYLLGQFAVEMGYAARPTGFGEANYPVAPLE